MIVGSQMYNGAARDCSLVLTKELAPVTTSSEDGLLTASNT